MREERKVINPETICNHLGIDPIVVIQDRNGNYVDYVDNKSIIYNHIHKLREMRIAWRAEHRNAFLTYRDGYETASHWDNKQEKSIKWKDTLSYEEFIDMRVPKKGIFLIPSPNNSREYIIPNPQEERQWIRKNIEAGGKGMVTRIESGIDAGHIEDTPETRRLIERFEPSRQLGLEDRSEVEKLEDKIQRSRGLGRDITELKRERLELTKEILKDKVNNNNKEKLNEET